MYHPLRVWDSVPIIECYSYLPVPCEQILGHRQASVDQYSVWFHLSASLLLYAAAVWSCAQPSLET